MTPCDSDVCALRSQGCLHSTKLWQTPVSKVSNPLKGLHSTRLIIDVNICPTKIRKITTPNPLCSSTFQYVLHRNCTNSHFTQAPRSPSQSLTVTSWPNVDPLQKVDCLDEWQDEHVPNRHFGSKRVALLRLTWNLKSHKPSFLGSTWIYGKSRNATPRWHSLT